MVEKPYDEVKSAVDAEKQEKLDAQHAKAAQNKSAIEFELAS